MVRGCWLLVVGCWLLAVGCWLLAVGCWLLVVGCWLLVLGSWFLVVVVVVVVVGVGVGVGVGGPGGPGGGGGGGGGGYGYCIYSVRARFKTAMVAMVEFFKFRELWRHMGSPFRILDKKQSNSKHTTWLCKLLISQNLSWHRVLKHFLTDSGTIMLQTAVVFGGLFAPSKLLHRQVMSCRLPMQVVTGCRLPPFRGLPVSKQQGRRCWGWCRAPYWHCQSLKLEAGL